MTSQPYPLQRNATRQRDTASGGRHDDLSSLHVTSLDQSYLFIIHINYMRYDKSYNKYFFQLRFIFSLLSSALAYLIKPRSFMNIATCCHIVIRYMNNVTFKTIETGLQISRASKNIGKFCVSYSELLSIFH